MLVLDNRRPASSASEGQLYCWSSVAGKPKSDITGVGSAALTDTAAGPGPLAADLKELASESNNGQKFGAPLLSLKRNKNPAFASTHLHSAAHS